MQYNKIEIAYMMKACKTKPEVEGVCKGLRQLVSQGAQQHSEFIRKIANKRVQCLKKTN